MRRRSVVRGFLLGIVLLALCAAPGAAQVHLLIVSGLGGEPAYVDEFHAWGTGMRDAAIDRLGVAPERVILLTEDPARDPARITEVSRLEEIEAALARIAQQAGPDEGIMVLLIGHGSADARGSRINLPGPDLTAEQLALWLGAFPTQPLVIVNSASASGDFHEALAAERRVVITATRSGMERNETLFGRYFVAAFSGEGADADRDGRVTIAEAFEYATRETERAYQSANRLQLEHARMEGDLELARIFHLGGSARSSIPADASPALRALHEERQRLEERIESVRLRSGQLEPEAYQRELESLLLELARTNRAIQESGGGG